MKFATAISLAFVAEAVSAAVLQPRHCAILFAKL
jgi:hypothetical protein